VEVSGLPVVRLLPGLVEVAGRPFPLPSSLAILPDTVTGLTVTQAITFRLKLADSEEVGSTSVLPRPRQGPPRALPPPRPRLRPGEAALLKCRCGHEVASQQVSRVLPLPSTGWQAGADGWYCCSKPKTPQPPSLLPRPEDVLYSPHSLLLRTSSLLSPPSTNSQLLCSSCEAVLGRVEGEVVHLWAHTITVAREEGEVGVLEGVESARDVFVVMVNTAVAESVELMPRVAVRAGAAKGAAAALLLWVVDRGLALVRGQVDRPAARATVLKVLFKEVEAVEESVVVLEMPAEVMAAGLEVLEESTRSFPESMRRVQGHTVGHLPSLAPGND